MDGEYEKTFKADGYNLVIGIDEAGRGPLAGPVVAAAVSIRNNQFDCKVSDSKVMSAKQREEAFYEIHEKAYVGVGIVSESVIDRGNILDATFLAMTNAVENLIIQFSAQANRNRRSDQDVFLLIDGNLFRSELPYAHRTIVKGDQSVLSIACASIIAKVTRDRVLNIYDQVFPEYGFRKHKGYPTLQHKQAIETHGLSLIHRRTFKHTLDGRSKN